MTATRDQRRRKREREKVAKAELRAPALAAAEVERKRLATWSLWVGLRALPGPMPHWMSAHTPHCGHARHTRHPAHGYGDIRRNEAAAEASRSHMGGRLGMLMLAAVLGGVK